MRYLLIAALLLQAVLTGVKAQKRVYSTRRLEGVAPRIDGLINEPVWDQVAWATDFVQREPFENSPPSQQTEFKILYDDNNLYVAVRALDNAPDSIVRRMSRRDGFEGDWVEINIDSYHDLRTAFSFSVNAAGVKGDEYVTNDSHWDASWNPVWYVKTSMDKEGWVAEMQIPLSQLRFGRQDEYVWGLQVNRRLFRKEEASSWQFISPNAPGWVHLFGELHGIEGIQPKKQREITPYALVGLESYQRDPENPYAPGKELLTAVGFDAKWGITNDFTLDLSINPDFGQVEADPSEVNLTVFETKFEEKRPFFIEGKEILSLNLLNGGGPLSNDNLFYSRRIGRRPQYCPDIEDDEYLDCPLSTRILTAAKITGKTRRGFSLGVMESITRNEVARVDHLGEESLVNVEPFTNYFAASARQDMNSGNTLLGGMLTATNRFMDDQYLIDRLHSSAYSAGIDFTHQWKDKTYYLYLKSAYSYVEGNETAIAETQTSAPHFFQRPDASHLEYDSTRTNIQGTAGTIQVGRQGNSKLRYTIWLTWRSPGFHLNDIGYHNRNDEIQEVAWMGFRETEPKGIIRNYNINLNQWAGFTFGGERLYLGGNTNMHWMFTNYWRMGFNIDREQPGLSTGFLRGGPAIRYNGNWNFYSHLSTNERKRFQFFFETGYNRVDERRAVSHDYWFGVRWQIADPVKLSLFPAYSKRFSELEWVEHVESGSDDRYILGKIDQETVHMTVRFSYNLTPDFTIELYAMPFLSTGGYTEFKYVTDPKADVFENRFYRYSDAQISYNEDDEQYEVDETLDGVTDYTFGQPNFNVFDFNANLVLRWEYLPGSTVYLVWSQQRSEFYNHGKFDLNGDVDTLFSKTYPHDVFLLKLSYRIGN